jgi:hypothetical protein
MSCEERKINNLNFYANNIHFDNLKASSKLLKNCKNDNIPDLLYSEQRKDFSHIAVYIKSQPNATWTVRIPENLKVA